MICDKIINRYSIFFLKLNAYIEYDNCTIQFILNNSYNLYLY